MNRYIKPKTTVERKLIAQRLLAGSISAIDDGVCPVCGKRNGHKGWCPYHKKH